MPPSHPADDWLKLTLVQQQQQSFFFLFFFLPTGESLWAAQTSPWPDSWLVGLWDTTDLVFTSPTTFSDLKTRYPPPKKTPSLRLPPRPPAFPPSLPLLCTNRLADGLYFAPQKHIVFLSTAGYSVCKGLFAAVLWRSITAEVPQFNGFLPLRGGTRVKDVCVGAVQSWHHSTLMKDFYNSGKVKKKGQTYSISARH